MHCGARQEPTVITVIPNAWSFTRQSFLALMVFVDEAALGDLTSSRHEGFPVLGVVGVVSALCFHGLAVDERKKDHVDPR